VVVPNQVRQANGFLGETLPVAQQAGTGIMMRRASPREPTGIRQRYQ
jgi:hypothetical protein